MMRQSDTIHPNIKRLSIIEVFHVLIDKCIAASLDFILVVFVSFILNLHFVVIPNVFSHFKSIFTIELFLFHNIVYFFLKKVLRFVQVDGVVTKVDLDPDSEWTIPGDLLLPLRTWASYMVQLIIPRQFSPAYNFIHFLLFLHYLLS